MRNPAAALTPYATRSLPLIFGGPVLTQLARTGFSQTLSYVLREAGWSEDGSPLANLYERAFAFLTRTYRCEYVYKNAIATKLLLGRHSLRTAALLTEVRADIRKADVVILNGTSTVYEIKTGLDNLDRLASQLAAYAQVFDRICVVTAPAGVERVAAAVPEHVGIIVLTQRFTLSTAREPESNLLNVSPGTIFGTLRQSEYTTALREELGEIPRFASGVIWRECHKLFSKLSPEAAHRHMVRALRARTTCHELDRFVSCLPYGLQHAGLTVRLTPQERVDLIETLSRPFAP